jgi:hypothetical protein
MESRPSGVRVVDQEHGLNPLQAAVNQYNELEDHAEALERELVGLRASNAALLEENRLLKGNYKTLQGNFHQLQEYSVGISTQLAVIQQTVGSAMDATSAAASKLFSSEAHHKDALEQLSKEFPPQRPPAPRKH